MVFDLMAQKFASAGYISLSKRCHVEPGNIQSKMEDFMATKPPPAHIRLPLRADAVSGREQQPGEAPRSDPAPDARTVSQDPVLTTK
jgi:hypothetical protein